jgi:hypothetical protein
LSKDVKRTAVSSEAFATVASVKLLVHALARDEEDGSPVQARPSLDTL